MKLLKLKKKLDGRGYTLTILKRKKNIVLLEKSHEGKAVGYGVWRIAKTVLSPHSLGTQKPRALGYTHIEVGAANSTYGYVGWDYGCGKQAEHHFDRLIGKAHENSLPRRNSAIVKRQLLL